MTDSLEIESLFRKSNRVDEPHYEKVEYVQLYDMQNGNYAGGQVSFNLDQTMKNHVVLSESLLVLPIRADLSVDARVTVKNSILSFVQGIVIDSGSGTSIANEQMSTPIVNNLRLLLDSSIDYVQGNELVYAGKDMHVETDASGQGLSVVGGVTGGASLGLGAVAGMMDHRFNPALCHRITCFTNRATHFNGVPGPTSPYRLITAYIPLKFLHDFFAKMDFPMINLSLRATFNVAGVSGGPGQNYMPWCTPAFAASSSLGNSGFISTAPPASIQTQPIAGTAAGAAFPGVAAYNIVPITPAVAAPTIVATVVGNATDQFGQAVAPRLLLKTVYFNAEESKRLRDEIVKGYTKELVYSCSNYYYQQTPATQLTTNWAFVQGVIRPTRVWVFPLTAGTLGASNNSFPASTDKYILSNCNILLNGNNFYNNRFYTQYDFYREFKTQLIGAGSATACATPISYNDWISGCRPYVFDLSRNPTVKTNNLCTLTLATDIQDPTLTPIAAPAAATDLWVIVERLQTVTFKVSEGGVEVVTKQGAAE